MQSNASSPLEYIKSLPEDRRQIVSRLRDEILRNLPEGFAEQMSYGMLGYVVPFEQYPSGYHADPKLPVPYMGLASQKHFVGVYHMGMYADKKLYDWFTRAYAQHTSAKPDMGKSCLRLKKMKDIPYDLIGELAGKTTVQEYIALYEKNMKK